MAVFTTIMARARIRLARITFTSSMARGYFRSGGGVLRLSLRNLKVACTSLALSLLLKKLLCRTARNAGTTFFFGEQFHYPLYAEKARMLG
jgi:hypothetical protein